MITYKIRETIGVKQNFQLEFEKIFARDVAL